MIPTGEVKTQVYDSIGKIEFFHPQANSLPGALLGNIRQAVESLGNNDDVKVIVITGRGEKTFCAGASFDEFLSLENIDDAHRFFMGFANLINAMRKTPKIIIGRINGKAVGGGVGLASACDYTIAVNNASVKLSELAIGIGPFVIAPAVERKIGKAAFSAMTIDTEWRESNWALQKGLFNIVAQNYEELDKEVNSLAKKLTQYNPDAIAKIKRSFWSGTKHWEGLMEQNAKLSAELVLTGNTRKMLLKFREK